MTARRQRARQGSQERTRAEILRAVRLALGVPVSALADVAAMAPSTISAYELGRRQVVRDAEVRLHNALSWFFDLAMTAAGAAEDAGLTKAARRLRRAG